MALPKMNEDVLEDKHIFYVDDSGLSVLICFKCGNTKRINTYSKNYSLKTFRVNCKCGASFIGQFEFRRYHRKKVRLKGHYKHRKTGVMGKIIVENISLMGVGFRCLRMHNFQKGDQLDITFTLDNPEKNVVNLCVEVRNIQDRVVGGKRCDTQSLQSELGFYLK